MKNKVLFGTIIALVASLMLLALTGCGADAGKQAAIDACAQASAVTSKAKAASYDMDYDLSATYSGFKVGASGKAKVGYALPDDLADINKAKLSMTYTCDINAIVEKMSMNIGAYLKDGTLYLSLESDKMDKPSKVSFTIPKELGDVLAQALEQIQASSLDLGDFEELMKSGMSLGGLDPKALDISKFVTKGSFQNGEIILDIDIWGYVKQVAVMAMRQGGAELGEALQAMKSADEMIKDCVMEVRATVDEGMAFTSMSVSITAKADLSAAEGMGGIGLGGNNEMDIAFAFKCPHILLNDAAKVEYPNLEGYEDITDQVMSSLDELMSGLMSSFGSGFGSDFGSNDDAWSYDMPDGEEFNFDFDDSGSGGYNFDFDDLDYDDYGGMTDEEIEKMLKEYGIDMDVDMNMGTPTKPGEKVFDQA